MGWWADDGDDEMSWDARTPGLATRLRHGKNVTQSGVMITNCTQVTIHAHNVLRLLSIGERDLANPWIAWVPIECLCARIQVGAMNFYTWAISSNDKALMY